jgi:hypothetical protein
MYEMVKEILRVGLSDEEYGPKLLFRISKEVCKESGNGRVSRKTFEETPRSTRVKKEGKRQGRHDAAFLGCVR